MQSRIRNKFFVTQQVMPGLTNGLINGGIAWAIHRGETSLGLWERGGYAGDLLATGFFLPAITWLILQPLLRRQARAGKAPVLAGLPVPWLTRWMMPSLWAGGLTAGLIGMGLLGGGAVLAMQGLGAPEFSGNGYAVFKGVYGAWLAVILQPAMVFAILSARSPA
ncbi:MAG: hypothetical protein JWP96_2690 [Polaromonas sp.]|jgi:hypothetical protein|nr:hypothetical protein [Polaromonas sp.]